MNFFKNQKGSLIIESIVAISIAITGLLGIMGLLSRSIALNKDVSQKFVATYLAAEGIEIVRSLVDANYADAEIWNSVLQTGSYELLYNSLFQGSGTSRTMVNGARIGDLTIRSTTPLKFDSATGIYSYASGETTSFKRTVKINNISAYEIKVASVIDWVERGADKSIFLEDHFFNWR